MYGSVNYHDEWTCYSSPQPPYNPHSGTNRVYTFNPSAPFSFIEEDPCTLTALGLPDKQRPA